MSIICRSKSRLAAFVAVCIAYVALFWPVQVFASIVPFNTMLLLIDQIGLGQSNIEGHVADDHRYRVYMGALEYPEYRVISKDLTGEKLIEEDGVVGGDIGLHTEERVFAAVVDKDTNKHWMVVANASGAVGIVTVGLNLTEDYTHLPLPHF
jgi:hypothetical protein